MGWSSRVIEALLVARRNGVERFEVAWRMALEAHPPGARELGPPGDRQALFDVELLEQGGEREESMVEFTRRVCADAWHGRRPVLGKLLSALDVFDRDEVLSGQVSRRRRAGALHHGQTV